MKKDHLVKDTLKLFWHHARKYPAHVTGLFACVPVTLLIQQFIPPLIVAGILDRLSKGQFESGDLWGSFGNELLLYGLLVFVGNAFAWRLIIVLIWKLELLVTRDLSKRVFTHLLNQSASFHANNFGGSLVSQATKLNGAYVRFADTVIFHVTTMITAFVITIVVLLPQAPLYVAALLAFSAIFIVSAFFVTRPVRKLHAIEASASSKQTGILADSLTNVMAVKSFSKGNRELDRYMEAVENTRAAGLNVMRAAIKRDAVFGSINGSIMAASLIIATASVVYFKNADIATVFLILNYTGNLTNRLWEFSTATLRNFNRSFGDARDMVETLTLEPAVKNVSRPEKLRIKKGEIAFKDVTFAHADSKEDILFTNFSLSIQAGEKIGLVGHSGSGKTTLTRLLLRFSDIDGGKIAIDGQDISKITQDDLRSTIAYVPQEPLLFHRSIMENIAYGNPGATKEQVIAASKKAHAHEFIERLPQGYETTVGERGVKLSGGQRQRIVIARAILKDAPILVLDEATSALDSESEQLIQQALWELMKGRTAIVIAHRLSTIQKMDRIVVLNNGTIEEEGAHKDLLAKRGTYANLWSHQSGGFIEE
ncbi:MAG TPA: ABC transporter ATP-binding protein [Candidatus Saccharimonadales bacterium]